MQNPNNLSRADNYVGQGIGGVNFFKGGITEIIIYSTPLSASQRKSVEAYVLGKYGIGNQPTLDTPTFSPASGVYPINQSISINQDQGAVCWFTTDGAAPVPNNPSSQWFNTLPIAVYTEPVSIETIAAAPFFTNSASASMTAQVEQDSLSLGVVPDFCFGCVLTTASRPVGAMSQAGEMYREQAIGHARNINQAANTCHERLQRLSSSVLQRNVRFSPVCRRGWQTYPREPP